MVFCMMLLLSSVKGSMPAPCGLDLSPQSSASSETYCPVEQADWSVYIPSLGSSPCPHLLGLSWGLTQHPATSRVLMSSCARGRRLLVVSPVSPQARSGVCHALLRGHARHAECFNLGRRSSLENVLTVVFQRLSVKGLESGRPHLC